MATVVSLFSLGLYYFTLDLYLIMLSIKQGEEPFFEMTQPGIEPKSFANTLLTRPMGQYIKPSVKST